MFGFDFPPRGWAFCQGQILPITQNSALFAVFGTTYGGDGQVTLALPDLRGRVPMHFSAQHPLGRRSGQEMHHLMVNELPPHSHPVEGGTGQDQQQPAGAYPGTAEDETYNTASNPTLVRLGADTIGNSGLGQGHENRQPYLVVNFSIALQGIFPSQ